MRNLVPVMILHVQVDVGFSTEGLQHMTQSEASCFVSWTRLDTASTAL